MPIVQVFVRYDASYPVLHEAWRLKILYSLAFVFIPINKMSYTVKFL